MRGIVTLIYNVRIIKPAGNTTEAERVREIFRQYLNLGCVSKLRTYLNAVS